jgi:hypothetical protein
MIDLLRFISFAAYLEANKLNFIELWRLWQDGGNWKSFIAVVQCHSICLHFCCSVDFVMVLPCRRLPWVGVYSPPQAPAMDSPSFFAVVRVLPHFVPPLPFWPNTIVDSPKYSR